MFDSRSGPSCKEEESPPEEPEKVLPKRLLTEEDIRQFVGGPWPVKGEDAEYTEEGNASDVSDDEASRPKRRRREGAWSDDAMTSFLAGSHFLEAPSDSSHPEIMPFFEMVLPPPIVDLIVSCTNQSAEILKLLQTRPYLYSQWKPITDLEFRMFLGLLYHMEEIKMLKIGDYWRKGRLFNIPLFQNMMAKNRFLGILGALSFNIVVPPPEETVLRDDRLYKVRPLLDHFNNLITSLHCPGIPSFDESLKAFSVNPLFASYTWYKKIGVYILHKLLEVGCLIYNDQFSHDKMTLPRFRLKVVDGLLPEIPSSTDATPPNTTGDKPHYMSYIGMNEKGKKRRKRCKYCMEVNNKRKESYFCCSGCPNNPGFCIDGCFAKFHGYS